MVNIKEINDVFSFKSPSLAKIKKDLGEKNSLGYLKLWLIEINSFAAGNTNSKMTDNDIEIAAKLIYQDYHYINLGDLKLISQRLKRRKFIRVSGNEIYQEIFQYDIDRSEAAQILSERESNLHKSDQNYILNQESPTWITLEEFKKVAESRGDNIDNINHISNYKSEREKNKEALIYWQKNNHKFINQ